VAKRRHGNQTDRRTITINSKRRTIRQRAVAENDVDQYFFNLPVSFPNAFQYYKLFVTIILESELVCMVGVEEESTAISHIISFLLHMASK